MLAKTVHASLEGMEAVVVGRSNIVGKPLIQLLLNENATVTVAHSRTRDLPAVVRRAELVFAAVGRPEMVRGDWIKPGATVIDVGINRVAGADGKNRIVGDVAYAEASQVAGAITPVPGGVGPMTIACLLVNTVRAACAIAGLPKLRCNLRPLVPAKAGTQGQAKEELDSRLCGNERAVFQACQPNATLSRLLLPKRSDERATARPPSAR